MLRRLINQKLIQMCLSGVIEYYIVSCVRPERDGTDYLMNALLSRRLIALRGAGMWEGVTEQSMLVCPSSYDLTTRLEFSPSERLFIRQQAEKCEQDAIISGERELFSGATYARLDYLKDGKKYKLTDLKLYAPDAEKLPLNYTAIGGIIFAWENVSPIAVL